MTSSAGTPTGGPKQSRRVLQSEISGSKVLLAPTPIDDSGSTNVARTLRRLTQEARRSSKIMTSVPGPDSDSRVTNASGIKPGQDAKRFNISVDGRGVQVTTNSPESFRYSLGSELADSGFKHTDRTTVTATAVTQVQKPPSTDAQKTGQSPTARERTMGPRQNPAASQTTGGQRQSWSSVSEPQKTTVYRETRPPTNFTPTAPPKRAISVLVEDPILIAQFSPHDDSRPGPGLPYDKLDSSVASTIITVTTRIEQWRDEIIRNKGRVTSMTDLDQILLSLSSTSSQITKLQQDYFKLTSLIKERESSIASLNAEVTRLEGVGVTMTQQMGALREDNKKLRVDISDYSSLKVELERNREALSLELGSARHEVEANVSLIEEKTKQVATLRQDYSKLQRDSSSQVAELRKHWNALSEDRDSIWKELQDSRNLVEKLKRMDTTKTEQLAAAHKEKEQVLQNFTALCSRIATLEERCSVQSKEIVSLRDDSNNKMAQLVAQKQVITTLTSEREGLVITARQDAEQLRKKLTVVLDEKADLQRRFNAQSIELDALDKLWKQFDQIERLIKSPVPSSNHHIAQCTVRPLEKEKEIGKLRRHPDTATSQDDDLQKSQGVLSSQVSAYSDELQDKTSQYEGTITSLTVQVNLLQATCNRKTAQLADAHSGLQKLQLEVSTCTTQLTELQGRFETQSNELTSVSEQLQTMKSCIQEKDHEVFSLTAERDQQKSVNATKAEQVSKLRQELLVYRSELAKHQALLQARSDEIVSLHRRVKTGMPCYEEGGRQVVELKRLNVLGVTATSKQAEDLQPELTNYTRSLIPSIRAFKQWMSEGSVSTSKPILCGDTSASSGDVHNMLIHNALLEARSKNWNFAYENAKKSIDNRRSTMGYIAKALALVGQGESEAAMQTYDLAFWNCDSSESGLLLLTKAIVSFLAGNFHTAISRIHDLMAISRDEETVYCCIQVLGKIHLIRGDYEGAVESLERGRSLASSCIGHDLEMITTIFGWTFDAFQITMQRYRCEFLRAADRADEAVKILQRILENLGEEIHTTSKGTAEWVTDLEKRCVIMLERLGDAALSSGKYDEAISRYSSALSLNASHPIDILVKRSKAQAFKGSWEDALMDANEVIKLDPSSHRGYERKCMALHGAENYVEANNALLYMLSVIERSPDKEIRRLRENYTSPREAYNAIDTAIREVFSLCPLVVIDLKTGQLCGGHERIQMFRSETPFKKLVSEIAISKLDYPHIRQAVAKYFKWIMFSHMWEGKEPSFQDVNLVDSVWSLDQSPLNEKLRQFCMTARAEGHRWAWSDTCCIDKTTSAILSQSLTSMYSWYEEAAETLVYLADVISSSKLGDLTKSRWMTRAWTLQELLASGVIRFYTRDWKPYLDDRHTNHKDSPTIKQELALAMGVTPETIANFRPEDLAVRDKLRLASTRNATVEEDIAYSLIGIFSSDIAPRYGLGKTALGHLLENIVARTGDVTVIAWTGKSLPYNSALPDTLAVYSKTPYSPPPMEADELNARVEKLRTALPPEDVFAFYKRFVQLSRATFANRCLHLPCVVFPVAKISTQETGGRQGNLYRASVPLLGRVEFRTADTALLNKPRKLVFVHPWLHDLRDPLGGYVSDDELEGQGDVSSDDDQNSESNVDASSSIDNSGDNAPADTFISVAPIHVSPSTHALQLIARLERPFNTLLLERQPNNSQYKRIATDCEIIIPGVSHQMNPKDLRAKVLEII